MNIRPSPPPPPLPATPAGRGGAGFDPLRLHADSRIPLRTEPIRVLNCLFWGLNGMKTGSVSRLGHRTDRSGACTLSAIPGLHPVPPPKKAVQDSFGSSHTKRSS